MWTLQESEKDGEGRASVVADAYCFERLLMYLRSLGLSETGASEQASGIRAFDTLHSLHKGVFHSAFGGVVDSSPVGVE